MNIQDNYHKNKKNIFFSENNDVQRHREKLINIFENDGFDKKNKNATNPTIIILCTATVISLKRSEVLLESANKKLNKTKINIHKSILPS